ncbi:MAG: intradiol ring-cleavage dioxygenase [Alphaproteobacteria bacterium]|nr:intradiol ring-cleavage dioxygenase [Alphaproteobacteria bacterium]
MTTINRRDAFKAVAVTASGGLLMSQQAFAQEAGVSATQTAALLQGADVCAIIPEVTEGPYYFDPALERTDITEGKAGIPMRVRLQVVDAACAPLEGARVDIWHCDATGVYSGYANQGDDRSVDTTGQTYLRGTQFADANGIVEFESIYPSWYGGRTTHVHFKVFLDQTTVLTGQMFFPDALSEYIYTNVAPYNDRTRSRDTLNSNDSIAASSTRAAFAFIKELEQEYLVAMIVGVDPTAASTGGMAGGAAAPQPPAGGAGGPPPDGTIPTGGQGGTAGTADSTSMTPAVKGN